MLSRRPLLLAALLAGACSKAPPEEKPKPGVDLAAPSMSGVPAAGAFRLYNDPSGRFFCEVPNSWTAGSDGSTETPNVSFTLRVPSVSDAKSFTVFTMSVYFYAEGNGQFNSVTEYVRRNTAAMPGVEATAVSSVQLKSGAAKRWDLTLPGLGAPEVIDAPKTQDTFVVVPSGKGFFALNYTSPADSHAAHLPEFERLLQSFAPAP